VSQRAKAVSMSEIYRFHYHATSRAVHFSVPELLRRIWGKPGSMTISSRTFERYWAAFAVYWGGWIYALTFLEILLLLQAPDFPDEKIKQIDVAMRLMRRDGAIPILTVQEVFGLNPGNDLARLHFASASVPSVKRHGSLFGQRIGNWTCSPVP
jgi:hypothetical protein